MMLRRSFSTWLLLALDLARVALDHHRIGIDHRFEFADARDVLAHEHDEFLAAVLRCREVGGDDHRAPLALVLDLGGVAPARGKRRLECRDVEFVENLGEQAGAQALGEPFLERVIGELEGETRAVEQADSDADGAQELLVDRFNGHRWFPQ